MKKFITAFLRWRGTGKMTTAKFDDIMKETAGRDLKWVNMWLRTTELAAVEKCVREFEKN